MQDANHLLNRIAFGPRPGDIERVQQLSREKYFEQQLHPERIEDNSVEERLAAIPSVRMNTSELINKYPQPQQFARKLGFKPADLNANNRELRRHIQEMYQEKGLNQPQKLLQDLQSQKIIRAVHSERQFQEVMTDFWFNHFNIFWGKNAERWLTTSFEMHAIRPHVFGKFKDLLTATAKSPAMLFYLDNHLSSSIKGINENYGRELMELHTLSVDGGYTQKDVQQVARAFTGWSIDAPQRNGEFMFRPRIHDTGPKVVLGHTIDAGGMRDGEEVLDILSKHPSTAHFISTKLVRRFVSDEPPANLVKHVSDVYRNTDGDIREMMRAIVSSNEFNSATSVGAKIKTPLEYVASAVRALGGTTDGGKQVAQAIGRMGQPLYQCQPPTGYPDRGDHWMSTGAVLERLNFAVELSANKLPGTAVQFDDPVKSVVTRLGSPDFQKR
jgi:uncharacterized protein (DUF1800 family)